MHAEDAYLFRHALLRDAAYSLHLPNERARLHGLALDLIESLFDGPPPEVRPQDGLKETHQLDSFAEELTRHARIAATVPGAATAYLKEREALYAWRAARYAELSHRSADVVRLYLNAAELAPESNWRRSRGLRAAGVACFRTANFEAGREYLLMAEGLAQKHQHLPELRDVQITLAGVQAQSGHLDEAEKLCRSALETAERVGDAKEIARVTGNLGIVLKQTGRVEEAEIAYRKALAYQQESGDRHSEGMTAGNIGSLLRVTGRLEESEKWCRDAIEIHRAVGNRRAEGVEMGNLANFLRDSGKLDEAEQIMRVAIQIHQETGNRQSHAHALGSLAILKRQQGQFAQAEATYLEALALVRELGLERDEGLILGNMANLLTHMERFDQADAMYERALTLHRNYRNLLFEGAHSCDWAICRLALGQQDSAKECWQRGVTILRNVHAEHYEREKTQAMQEACAKAGVEPFDVPKEGNSDDK